ncbi:LysR family transcriptional regulator [Myxococcota bacterium]|nr:LysR family transcriptional regulator [Myxococcota bacterium]MBU1537930.1 LysR family transcriptional regulator [Myxococcota bacterium]
MNPFLDLQQLRAFYFVGQTGSFTAAAQKLGRTQSAVSHAVGKLEEGLMTVLFVRKGRSFHLTEAGSILYEGCERAFYALDEAMESMALTQGNSRGHVRLGVTVEFGCSILIRQMEPFIQAHPEINLDFYMGHNLLEKLLSDELDIIIDCVDHQRSEVTRTPLFRELYAVVAAPHYVQCHDLGEVSDLDRCTILSMDDSGDWWRNFLYSIPGTSRPSLKKHRFITINLIRGMIAAAEEGMGVALVPQYSVMKELTRGTLVQLFPHIHLLEDQFSIYQKSARSNLSRHTLFTRFLQNLKPQEFLMNESSIKK